MTRIFAHRGASGSCPENTMPAFRAAAETGCYGIELDIQLTKDGHIVVIHDETVDRTTDGKGKVCDFELAELRKLDAGAGFAGRFGFNPVPTLREYFEFVKNLPIVTNIELKNGINTYPGMEEKLVAMVGEFGLKDRVFYSSFNHQSLLECKRLSPGCAISFAFGGWLIDAGAYCAAHGGDYVQPRALFLTPENVEELDRHGVRANAWTVNDPSEMKRLAGMGVYSLITNEPLKAVEILKT